MAEPITCYRRVAGGISTLINPGDFFWTYSLDDGWGNKPINNERDPIRLWYLNPFGRVGSITINPSKQEDGAGWNWDRNLSMPTITPSINELGEYDKERNWHGWIRKGIMTTA